MTMGEIIDLYPREADEAIDPNELNDEEVVDAFLSETLHPMSSRRIGETVVRLAGESERTDLSDTEISWRIRTTGLMVSTGDLDELTYERFIRDDATFRKMAEIAIATRDHAHGHETEREALNALRDLRSGVLHREQNDDRGDERWLDLVRRLGRLVNDVS